MKTCVSIVYLTYRPGGIDTLAMSLACQLPLYELIVVDGLEGRPERGTARAYLEKRGIPVRWFGPPKPKSFDTAINLANAMNTGAMHATTDRVIFLHDFTYLYPNDLENWMRSFEENGTKAIISGVAQICRTDPPEEPDDVTLWRGCRNPLSRYLAMGEKWVPEVMENFYVGMCLQFLDRVNGIDERADDHITWPLESMIAQARFHGYRLVVDKRMQVLMADHRSWPDDGGLWHGSQLKGQKDPNDEPGWRRVSPNPWNFQATRTALKEEGK